MNNSIEAATPLRASAWPCVCVMKEKKCEAVLVKRVAQLNRGYDATKVNITKLETSGMGIAWPPW